MVGSRLSFGASGEGTRVASQLRPLGTHLHRGMHPYLNLVTPEAHSVLFLAFTASQSRSESA